MAAEESRTEGRRGCSFCSTWKAPFPATATPERRTASEPSRTPPDPPETCTLCTFPHLISALAGLVAQPLPRRRKTFFFFPFLCFCFSLAYCHCLICSACVRVLGSILFHSIIVLYIWSGIWRLRFFFFFSFIFFFCIFFKLIYFGNGLFQLYQGNWDLGQHGLPRFAHFIYW